MVIRVIVNHITFGKLKSVPTHVTMVYNRGAKVQKVMVQPIMLDPSDSLQNQLRIQV